MVYKTALRPLLFALQPESAHHAALFAARVLGIPPLSSLVSLLTRAPDDPCQYFGLKFRNRVGLAAGFDKNVEAFRFLSALGFGHVELGTVTMQPQAGNPQPRMFRLAKDLAIINRMGFPSWGAQAVQPNLAKAYQQQSRAVIGINIGKSRSVAPEDAIPDYLASYKILAPWADYVAINISSPNTPGLRTLQDKGFIVTLLSRLRKEGPSDRPILIKIAPDLDLHQLQDVLQGCREGGADGVIATNTTLSRDGLRFPIDQQGGLSGRPLRDKSLRIVEGVRKILPEMPIIGVGGIFGAEDAKSFRIAGADLVQIYTSLVYRGPFIVPEISKALASCALL